jgi:hypothetical protein
VKKFSNLKVIQAPTATGKSTKLCLEISNSDPYDRLGTVVIEPRIQNAASLAAYMTSQGHIAGQYTGSKKEPTQVLDYATTGCGIELIKSPAYSNVVFDEIQDLTPESVWMLLESLKSGKKTYMMSATIPLWVSSLTDEIEQVEPQKRNFSVTARFGVTFKEFLNGSTPKPFKKNDSQSNEPLAVKLNQTLKEVLKTGNALIFLNGEIDRVDFWDEHQLAIQKVLKETKSTLKIIFRGTADSADMLKRIHQGTFPNKGVLIISNTSLGAGVNIPNLKAIWDCGKAIRCKSTLERSKYEREMWYDGINHIELEQRMNRVGRMCDGYYYCGLPYKKIRNESVFPFETNETDIVEVAAYLPIEERKEYFEFLKKFQLISTANDLEERLNIIAPQQVHKIYDGFNIFLNLKAQQQRWDAKELKGRILSSLNVEARKRITPQEMRRILDLDPEYLTLLDINFCSVQSRIFMLAHQANKTLKEMEEKNTYALI